MHKLLHLIFGWDYIQWSNFADQGISRIHVDGRGVVFYWRYWGIEVADRLYDPEKVLWLTCSPEKYFRNDEGKEKTT